MTKKECAIVMAYTGITMLSGEDFNIYHKYIEDIMGRPVWTHELANESVVEEIKEKSKYDFLKLCEKTKYNDLTPMHQEPKTRWIPVSERLPTEEEYIANNGLFIVSDGNRTYAEYFDAYNSMKYFGEPTMNGFDRCVIAWMPVPKPYEPQKRSDKE